MCSRGALTLGLLTLGQAELPRERACHNNSIMRTWFHSDSQGIITFSHYSLALLNRGEAPGPSEVTPTLVSEYFLGGSSGISLLLMLCASWLAVQGELGRV